MTLAEQLSGLLGRLGAVLYIGPPPLSDRGEALIRATFQGRPLDILVVALETEDVIHLSTEVGTLADNERMIELAAGLLGANALGAATRGLSLAWSPTERHVYLGYSLLGSVVNYPTFEAAFARLVTVAAHWKNQLDRAAP